MIKDSEKMLKMLNHFDINKNFSFAGKKFTLDEVINFINMTNHDSGRIDYAITDGKDNYLGTISLKNINHLLKEAEYAISLTYDAIGTGVAILATDLLIEKAVKELKLKSIYLKVKKNNFRAINFYKKYGFKTVENKVDKDEDLNLIWFVYKLIN